MPRPMAKSLAQPFPTEHVHKNPSGGGTYAKQSTYNQKLLLALNASFDFAVSEVIRGDVAALVPDPNGKSDRAKTGAPALGGVVVGALCTLACEVDGRPTTITEVGEVEDPHNWKHDGQRLKDAASDGLKRCAARLGVGLHLRDESEYFLFDVLTQRDEPRTEPQLPGMAKEWAADDPSRPFEHVPLAPARPVAETSPV